MHKGKSLPVNDRGGIREDFPLVPGPVQPFIAVLAVANGHHFLKSFRLYESQMAAYNIHDEVTMNRWVKHIFSADPEYADCGEREMWGAWVAMASGQPAPA